MIALGYGGVAAAPVVTVVELEILDEVDAAGPDRFPEVLKAIQLLGWRMLVAAWEPHVSRYLFSKSEIWMF